MPDSEADFVAIKLKALSNCPVAVIHDQWWGAIIDAGTGNVNFVVKLKGTATNTGKGDDFYVACDIQNDNQAYDCKAHSWVPVPVPFVGATGLALWVHRVKRPGRAKTLFSQGFPDGYRLHTSALMAIA